MIAMGEQAAGLAMSLAGNLCLVVAAAAAGVIEVAHEKALAYTAERYQGGRMIIDHTHLQNMLGNLASDAMTCVGSLTNASFSPKDVSLAIGTKIHITECAVRSCSDAVQLLGGYGYMREYGLEKALRDAAALSLLPMSNAWCQMQIVKLEKQRLM